jgi:hypothetical protein
MGTMGSREGFICPAMRREEKGAVVRYTKVIGVRGVDRGLGYNMGTDKKLPKGRGIL